jgi:hypothetical protein
MRLPGTVQVLNETLLAKIFFDAREPKNLHCKLPIQMLYFYSTISTTSTNKQVATRKSERNLASQTTVVCEEIHGINIKLV